MTLRVNDATEFINSISLLVDKKQEQNRRDNDLSSINKYTAYKMGKIPSSYTGGRPTIIFEGETTASLKRYPYLSSYTPQANDWVLLASVGKSYIVLGKIT